MSKPFVETQEKEQPAPLVVRMPTELMDALDDHVVATDSDRSKFARTAIREKLAREVRRSKRGN